MFHISICQIKLKLATEIMWGFFAGEAKSSWQLSIFCVESG